MSTRENSQHAMLTDAGEDAPLLSTKVFFSGLSFALFGIAGLILSITVFPLLYLLPISSHRRKRTARRLLAALFPVYIGFMQLCGLIKIRRHGCDTLGDGGQLIVANHPSLLDVVYLIASVRNANCLVKRSLFFNPFTAGTVRAAGYIRNDSNSLLQECSASLQAGDSLIVFPEGTRTDPAGPLKFLRGTANIALAAKCDITPVVIRCQPARLMKHQAWYEMSTQTLAVDIEAFPKLPIAPYLDETSRRSLMSRKLTADLENFYRRC